MASAREVGTMRSVYGTPVTISLSLGDVCVDFGGTAAIFGAEERNEFMRLWCEAERQAEAAGDG